MCTNKYIKIIFDSERKECIDVLTKKQMFTGKSQYVYKSVRN